MFKQVQQGRECSKIDNLFDFISEESRKIELKNFKNAPKINKDISKKLEKLEKIVLEEKPKQKEKPFASSIQVKKKEVIWL